MNKILSLVYMILSITTTMGCSEYFGHKPSGVNMELLELILLHNSRGGRPGCGRFSLEPIRGGPDSSNMGTNGTRTGFNFANCTGDSDIRSMGFETNNITFTGNGVQGLGTSSRIASLVDFVTLGGRKDQVIEVTFRIDRPDGFLDVFVNSSVGSGATANGPGFRIRTERILAFGTTSEPAGFPMGTTPTTPVGQTRSYCLEVHDEGTAHLLGWSRPCGSLSQADRQNNEFDFKNLPSAQPGNRVGFMLNGVTLFEISVGERISLKGQVRQ